MSYTHNQAMKRRWLALMKDVKLDTVFDNEVASTSPTWARFSIRNADSQQADISTAPRTRTVGVIIIQLFTRVGELDGEVMQLADKAKNVFRLRTVDGITYREPTITTVGAREGWWQVNVTCPFEYEEIVERD